MQKSYYGNSAIVCLLAFLLVLAGVSCGTASKARKGYVAAQYDYAKKCEEKNNKHEAFYWMKQSANGLYPKAMRDLAIYYSAGYGGEVDIKNAVKWILKYATISPENTQEVLEMVKKMFDSSTIEENQPVLNFLKELLIIEHGQHFSSTTQKKIASEMQREMNLLAEYWINKGKYQMAQQTVKFCMDIAVVYTDIFDNSFFIDSGNLQNRINEGKKVFGE